MPHFARGTELMRVTRLFRLVLSLAIVAVSAVACTSQDQHVTPGGSGGVSNAGSGGGGGSGSGGSGEAGVMPALHPLAISGQEAVTRVAMFLWLTAPGSDLLGRAAGLKTREDVNLLALNMLKDPRARAGVTAFYRSWLWLDKEDPRDSSANPEWTPALKADVAKAAELFAVNVTLDMNGSFRTLMTGAFTYVNERLAKFYGIPGITGSDFQKVDLDPKQRGGVLSQSALMGRDYPGVRGLSVTNPPMRGRVIRNRLYCQDLAPVHMPVIPPHAELSIRQFFATVTAGISDGVPCVICHYGFELNALGFPFESLDAFGRLRTMDDRKHPLDLRGFLQNGLGAEAAYDGPVELGGILADSPDVQGCFGSYWAAFASGLDHADPDKDFDPSTQAAFRDSGLNLRVLIAAVVSSERVLGAAGANRDGGTEGSPGNDAGDDQPDADAPPAVCSVPAILSKHNCTGLCHAAGYTPSAGGGFDMVTPGWEKKLVGNGPPATAPETNECKGKGLNYLNKTLPATGLFLDKLKPTVPCGKTMPIVGGALSPAELACVQKWADNLAASGP
jgi:Protein of unknown function (DUF1592)/Protein of unknown function (DUF1588)/Protein of unknown function (DUF1585)